MRSDWVPMSASALVTGAMALVLGGLLNPNNGGGGQDAADTLRVVQQSGGRWMAMAVLYFGASVAMTLGLPSVISLFTYRGRRLGLLAVGVFSVGVLGLAGYAMLMVFFRALVTNNAVRVPRLDAVVNDAGLNVFLYSWITAFYGGVLLLAAALFVARRTQPWVPSLLVVFAVMLPVANALGRVAQAVQLLALAVAFTGLAIAATSPTRPELVTREAVF